MDKTKIAIIGSGSWGLALGYHLVNSNNNVKVWSFSEEERDELNINHRSKYLPDVVFSEDLKCYTDFKSVITGAKYIFHVTPSIYTRDTVQKYKEFVTDDQIIVICSKGFEKQTRKTLEQVISEELPKNKIAVFTGPSHAEEVSKDIPTCMVIASRNTQVTDDFVKLFEASKMRIYKSDDIIGTALGGALKNIIALCAGVVYELNYGDNTFAALVTRGLVELSRFSHALGANPKTIYGLSGLGDLIVTCMSEYSRNRKAGILLARGHKKKEIKNIIGQTVEGIDNIESAYFLAKDLNVEMPIVDAVYRLLNEDNIDVAKEIEKLMLRTNKYE